MLLGEEGVRRVPLQAILPSEDSHRSADCALAFARAIDLRNTARRYYGKTKSHWMHLAHEMLSDLERCGMLSHS